MFTDIKPDNLRKLLISGILGNDKLSPSDIKQHPLLASEFQNGAPFDLVGCGTTTTILAFAGISAEGQKLIATDKTNHRVFTFDFSPLVKAILNETIAAAKNSDSFEIFFENYMDMIYDKVIGRRMDFSIKYIQECEQVFRERVSALKSIFHDPEWGYKAFVVLLEKMIFEHVDWNKPDDFIAALEKHKIGENTIYQASNIYQCLYMSDVIFPMRTLLNPDRSSVNFLRSLSSRAYSRILFTADTAHKATGYDSEFLILSPTGDINLENISELFKERITLSNDKIERAKRALRTVPEYQRELSLQIERTLAPPFTSVKIPDEVDSSFTPGSKAAKHTLRHAPTTEEPLPEKLSNLLEGVRTASSIFTSPFL